MASTSIGALAEAFERITRAVDHRPSGCVETGVDDHRHAGTFGEPADRGVQKSVAAVDSLDPGSAVDMSDGRNRSSATASSTSWTKSMYGLGIGPPEKISAARSASTIGATGRNCSRPLTVLSRSRLSIRRGSASSDRPPSAAWSEFGAALKPADQLVVGERIADRRGQVVGSLIVGWRLRRASRRSRHRTNPRPSAADGIGVIGSPDSPASASAAPSAVPASPAAGCTHTLRKRTSSVNRVNLPRS